jgi:Ca2+-binding EF-hand superfamily protein
MFLKILKDLIITIIILVVSLYGSKYIVKNFSKILEFLKDSFQKISKNVTDKVSQKEIKSESESESKSEIKNQTFPNAEKEAQALFSCLNKYQIIDNNKNIIFNELRHLLNLMNVTSTDVDKIASVGIIMSAGETSSEKFNRIDNNENKFISTSEMQAMFLPSDVEKVMLETCDTNFGDVFTDIDELVSKVFEDGDKNNDKKISYDEFKTIYMIQLLRFYKRLEPSFNFHVIDKLFQ